MFHQIIQLFMLFASINVICAGQPPNPLQQVPPPKVSLQNPGPFIPLNNHNVPLKVPGLRKQLPDKNIAKKNDERIPSDSSKSKNKKVNDKEGKGKSKLVEKEDALRKPKKSELRNRQVPATGQQLAAPSLPPPSGQQKPGPTSKNITKKKTFGRSVIASFFVVLLAWAFLLQSVPQNCYINYNGVREPLQFQCLQAPDGSMYQCQTMKQHFYVNSDTPDMGLECDVNGEMTKIEPIGVQNVEKECDDKDDQKSCSSTFNHLEAKSQIQLPQYAADAPIVSAPPSAIPMRASRMLEDLPACSAVPVPPVNPVVPVAPPVDPVVPVAPPVNPVVPVAPPAGDQRGPPPAPLIPPYTSDPTSVTMLLQNSCSYPLWPAFQGEPLVANGGQEAMQPGDIRPVQVPFGWSAARIWVRTGCNTTSMQCETGDCGNSVMNPGSPECQGRGGVLPMSLAEFTLGTPQGAWYDVSFVDGFNVPISITPIPGTYSQDPTNPESCVNIGCWESWFDMTFDAELTAKMNVPPNMENPAGIRSLCSAENTDEVCCRGAFNSGEICKPSIWSQADQDAYNTIKASCPNSYLYAYDDHTSLFTCTGGNGKQSPDFHIKFC